MFKEYQNIHHMLLTFQCLNRFNKLFDKFTNKNNSVISWISNGDKPNRGLCGQRQEKLSNSYLVCFKNKRNFWNFTNDYKEDFFKALDIFALHTKKFFTVRFSIYIGSYSKGFAQFHVIWWKNIKYFWGLVEENRELGS